jgi:hypothetical protein
LAVLSDLHAAIAQKRGTTVCWARGRNPSEHCALGRRRVACAMFLLRRSLWAAARLCPRRDAGAIDQLQEVWRALHERTYRRAAGRLRWPSLSLVSSAAGPSHALCARHLAFPPFCCRGAPVVVCSGPSRTPTCPSLPRRPGPRGASRRPASPRTNTRRAATGSRRRWCSRRTPPRRVAQHPQRMPVRARRTQRVLIAAAAALRCTRASPRRMADHSTMRR